MPNEVKLLPCPLRDALTKCREKFDFYEQLHRLKCTAESDEKADRNREMVEMCDAALSRPTTILTDEVVERVARALYKSAQDYALQNAPKNAKLPTWESEDQEARDVMASMARAALASVEGNGNARSE